MTDAVDYLEQQVGSILTGNPVRDLDEAFVALRAEHGRLRRVERNALDLRAVVEGMGVSGSGRVETLQAQCRLVVRAFDEGCSMTERLDSTAPDDPCLWGETPIELLHVIAQPCWHDPAFLIGNRLGLERARAAIDAALAGGGGEAAIVANDGEGYRLVVRCVTTEGMGEVPYGYTDEIARVRDRWPEWMRKA